MQIKLKKTYLHYETVLKILVLIWLIKVTATVYEVEEEVCTTCFTPFIAPVGKQYWSK